jgi:hypothetical protein
MCIEVARRRLAGARDGCFGFVGLALEGGFFWLLVDEMKRKGRLFSKLI